MVETGSHYHRSKVHLQSGAIEPQFYAQFLQGLGLKAQDLPGQHDNEHWPAMKQRFAEVFATKTQAEWTEIFEGTDACVTPVLSFRDTIPGATEIKTPEKQWPRQAAPPQPAPILSRTPALQADHSLESPFLLPGKHTIEVLTQFGLDKDHIKKLLQTGAVMDIARNSRL